MKIILTASPSTLKTETYHTMIVVLSRQSSHNGRKGM
jgi:hypothetical protein